MFGRRQDAVFLKLQELLAPFGITQFYTDGWGAYERHLDAEQHQVGKEHTQKIESKHIKQLLRSLRRNRLPVKLIDGAFLMRHEYAACALVELMQIGKAPSSADPVLQHAPEAFDGIQVVAAPGR